MIYWNEMMRRWWRREREMTINVTLRLKNVSQLFYLSYLRWKIRKKSECPRKPSHKCMRTRKSRRKKNHKKLFIRLIQHVPWILIWHAHLRKSSWDSWAFVYSSIEISSENFRKKLIWNFFKTKMQEMFMQSLKYF